MPKIEVDDAHIYYESHGTGIPILLVSGLGGVSSYWNPNIPAFSQRHQVVVQDHRGTGQISPSRIRYSVDQMTGDLLALMDQTAVTYRRRAPRDTFA
jgi:aminoacrylate hydrolase